MKDFVLIVEAIIEALEHNTYEFSINKSTIQRIHSENRKERAEAVKVHFLNQQNTADSVIVWWYGKL